MLTDKQVLTALAAVEGRRYPARDRVMVLLSVKAGLQVTDAEGNVARASGAGVPCRLRACSAMRLAP